MPLLERQGRNVVLTDAGRVLVAHTDDVLSSLERAAVAVARTSTEVAGQVRMGVFESAVPSVAVPVIEALAIRHPLVDVRLVQSDDIVDFRALRLGDLDLALAQQYSHAPIDLRSDIEYTELLTEEMYLAVPEGVCPEGIDIDELAGLSWIAEGEHPCGMATMGYCRGLGFEPDVRYWIADFASMLRIVAAGLGATVLPHLAVLDPPKGVVTLPLDRSRWSRTLLVATRPGSAGHPAISAVVEALTARARLLEEELDQRSPALR
jgi:DNA-binding transcriptional LysR family regulator